MALQFHPQRGTILFCDFTTGFVEPEMVKKRPVIVISGQQNGGICTVVPISSKAPSPVKNWHYLIPTTSVPPVLQDADNWAKCDMITAVAMSRLDRIQDGRKPDGTRRYICPRLGKTDMAAIEVAILSALCMKHLTVGPT